MIHRRRQTRVADMRIELRGRQIGMAQQRLDVEQIGPGFEQAGAVGVPQFVRGDTLVDLRLLDKDRLQKGRPAE